MTVDPPSASPPDAPMVRGPVVAGVIAGVVVGVIVLIALAGLTAAVVLVDGPLPGEVALIRRLQELGQPAPAFADLLGFTTGTEGNLVVGVAPAAWLVRRYGRRGVAAVAICLIAMLVVQPVTKVLVDRDRPDETQVEVRAEATSRSYPSGHSLSTTTVWGTAALLAARTGRRRGALAASLPIPCTAVASSVHGVHWASDAIAGTIIGGVAAWAAVRVLHVRRTAPDADRLRRAPRRSSSRRRARHRGPAG